MRKKNSTQYMFFVLVALNTSMSFTVVHVFFVHIHY